MDPITSHAVASLPRLGEVWVGAIYRDAVGVLERRNGRVYRINLQTNQVGATIPVGRAPQALSVGYGALVLNGRVGQILRIDPEQTAWSLP